MYGYEQREREQIPRAYGGTRLSLWRPCTGMSKPSRTLGAELGRPGSGTSLVEVKRGVEV